MLRRKFFKQNHGQLLEQLVNQRAGIAERMIITLDELEKATQNFAEDLVIGNGGHGTVYKGILSNQHIVAIKKPKNVLQREIDEFINEVAILSQISHRNVVKLYGCCLETEAPLLIYEFISNGTLYDHLHVEGPKSLSWQDRLPMYFYTGRLTEKSDVFSFGVVLVELLTRKKPFSYVSSDDEALVIHFASLFAQGNLVQILDPQVMEEGGKEVDEVAAIALECIKWRPEDRPTMRQVELSLEVVQNVCNNNGIASDALFAKDRRANGGSIRRYSMEEEFYLSARYPR